MKCNCFYAQRRDGDEICYVFSGRGIIWSVFPPCPIHQCQAVEVLWAPSMDNAETATVPAVTASRP